MTHPPEGLGRHLPLFDWRLETLEERNSLRMNREGWVEVTTDGEQIWVEAERM